MGKIVPWSKLNLWSMVFIRDLVRSHCGGNRDHNDSFDLRPTLLLHEMEA